MNDVSDTELLSAYLDGELTAVEQVRVERILAISPEARQLLEEMRALGCTLQELPQEKLGEDLSTRVLEVAERRMLLLPNRLSEDAVDKPSAGRAAESLNQPEADSTGSLGIWREISWRGMFNRRALVWSCVVVATAIIINFTSPPPPKLNQNITFTSPPPPKLNQDIDFTFPPPPKLNRDIAKADKEPAAAATIASGEKRGESSTADGSWDAPANHPKKPPAVDLLAKDESRMPADAKESEKKKAPPIESIAEAKPVPAASPLPEATVPSTPGQPELPRPDVAKPRQPGPLGPDVAESVTEPQPTAVVMSKALAPSKAPGGGPAKGGAGKKGYGYADIADNSAPRSPNDDIANQSVAKSSETAQLMNGTGFAQAAGNSSSAGALATNNLQGGQAMPNRSSGRKAPAATVIRINISALAVQNRVFENLIAYHGLGIDQNRQQVVSQSASPAAQHENSRLGIDQNRQQIVSQSASPAVQHENPRGCKNEDNLQGTQSGVNSQRRIASQAAGGQLDRDKNLQQQLPENLSQKPANTEQKQETQSNFAINSKPIVYEFDASTEQLAILIKQIGERPDSFSISEIEVAGSASQAMDSFAQNQKYRANNSSGGMGGMSEKSLANRPGEPRQAKGDTGKAGAAREEKSQSQSVQASGSTKQHVVFVLRVVDRVPRHSFEMGK